MKEISNQSLIRVPGVAVPGLASRNEETSGLNGLAHSYKYHAYSVRSVAITPDGRYLVVTNEANPIIRVVDLDLLEYKKCRYEGHHSTVRLTSITPDGRYLYSASWDQTIRKFDFNTGACLETFGGIGRSPSCFVDPRQKYLFGASYDKCIDIGATNTGRCWDLGTKEMINTYPHWISNRFTESIDIAYDQRYVYSGSDDGVGLRWELHSGKPSLEYFNDRSFAVRKIAVSVQYFMAACTDGRVRAYYKQTGKLFKVFTHSPGFHAMDVKISHDEKSMFSASADGTLKCFDLVSRKLRFRQEVHTGMIWSICLTNADSLLISGGCDGTVAFSDNKGKLLARCINLSGESFLITCPPDKSFPRGCFYTTNTKLVRVFRSNPETGQEKDLPGDDPLRTEYIDSLNMKQQIIARLRNKAVYDRLVKNLEKRKQLAQSLHSLKTPGLLNA